MQEKTLIRALSAVLFVGGLGHTAGTIFNYAGKPETMLWSLCTSLFVFLLASVNWLRATRLSDRPLAWIALVFNLGWLAACIQFGRIVGSVVDPRVLLFAGLTLGLAAMAARTLARPRA